MKISSKGDDSAVVKSKRAFPISLFIVLLIVFCIAAGHAAFLYANQNKTKRIVVIDIEKIIEQRKEEFARKYSSSDINNATTKSEMSDDIKMFAERLEEAIALESRDKIILSRASVVSNDIDDITGKVISHIWEK